MENVILEFIPILDQYPFLLAIVECCTFLFFGGIIFSSLWNLITGYAFNSKR